jgi:nitrogen fixation protein NifB
MPDSNCQNKAQGHPCFDRDSHCRVGRIHLPVAPACNIQCKFCSRKHDCANESRPGVTSKVITPGQALELVTRVVALDDRLRVVGIAGPGDPLVNAATCQTFALIGQHFPALTKCLSTNGLLLSERLDSLMDVGLDTLTVTVNALRPWIGARIYSWIEYRGQIYYGEDAAHRLFNLQIEGIQKAVRRGLRVKVNSVLIPGINEEDISDLSVLLKGLGVDVMNIMPLIPQAEMAGWSPVAPGLLNHVRDRCAPQLTQFRQCRQCRADAIGVPGLENSPSACVEERS